MDLADIERDFLGDLAEDTHGIWEVFEYVRGRAEGLTDVEIFDIGRKLIATWAGKGWIRISDKPLYRSQIRTLDDAMIRLDELGVMSTRYFDGAPSIDLTESATKEIPGLSGAG